MKASITHTGDPRWDAVATILNGQPGDIVATETRDGQEYYNLNFPKLPDGSGYGGMFLGVPASVVTII